MAVCRLYNKLAALIVHMKVLTNVINYGLLKCRSVFNAYVLITTYCHDARLSHKFTWAIIPCKS